MNAPLPASPDTEGHWALLRRDRGRQKPPLAGLGQLMNTSLGPAITWVHISLGSELEPWFHHNLLPSCSSFSRAVGAPSLSPLPPKQHQRTEDPM